MLLFWSLPGTIRDLQSRNQTSIDMAENIANIVAFTEPNAVILSYHFNDQVQYYGQRSVLNYRRIPPSDSENGRFQVELLEPCLVQTINRLFAQEIPVYFFEDSNPTYWDALDILRQNYNLTAAREKPVLYLLTPQTDQPQTVTVCPTPSMATKLRLVNRPCQFL